MNKKLAALVAAVVIGGFGAGCGVEDQVRDRANDEIDKQKQRANEEIDKQKQRAEDELNKGRDKVEKRVMEESTRLTGDNQ